MLYQYLQLYHEDMQQAVSYLQSTEGNVLATTGSKQVDELCKLEDFARRVYLRILPSEEMKAKCLALGFLPEHIICAQGPFSRKSNECILREYDIKYLLTKQSGKTGGYPEKAEAAHNCGVELVVLGILMIFNFASPIAAFIGMISLKVSAYLAPFTHKLFRR